ncbi:MAG: SGNH/GDSL hydrolase family protein [Thermoanaerobaculia bacterium]
MQNASRTYLALGDSYTAGEGVAARESWPHVLNGLLEARGHRLDLSVVARTGWTAAELHEAARNAPLPAKPALTTLLVGVNDQYRGLPIESFREELGRLLELVAGRGPSSRLLVLSIPDWGVTPFATGRDRAAIALSIDSFNETARTLALASGARWIDITPLAREAAGNPALLAGDGLHFSPLAHRLLAESALSPALEILEVSPEGFPQREGFA